jgi:hypothetical protein
MVQTKEVSKGNKTTTSYNRKIGISGVCMNRDWTKNLKDMKTKLTAPKFYSIVK